LKVLSNASSSEVPDLQSPCYHFFFIFFIGLAIGLQDNAEEVLQIFAAVVLHKCVIAFGLSLNLVQSQLRTGVVIQLTLIFWYEFKLKTIFFQL
jgi:hypothetical protein